MITGTTVKKADYGGPDNVMMLPAGARVCLTPARNLPDDSPIKYWACPIDATGKLQPNADGLGIGLRADDVRLD